MERAGYGRRWIALSVLLKKRFSTGGQPIAYRQAFRQAEFLELPDLPEQHDAFHQPGGVDPTRE
ncbi:hypothetical protein [Aureimonas altamirensis]|uniref:hypothetical protein n=1 Tax=Aureimonas altamirensis TaxID=370622 RepID=UPI0012E33259|nr:hypothetical protein [Aureimonas altamirensis]